MKNNILSLLVIPLLAACLADKGNDAYRPAARLSITGIPATIEVFGSAEHLVVAPLVTSDVEGEIRGDNPDFSFLYMTGKDDTLARAMTLDTLANFRVGTYPCWFIVTDNRTGLAASTTFTLKVTSPLYEGYMVLSNDGPDERARLDMIARVADSVILARDVMTPLGLPEIHHATAIGFSPTTRPGIETIIYLLSREGGYLLNWTSFETSEEREIRNWDFITPPPAGEHVVKYFPFVGLDDYLGPQAIFAVSDAGNLYGQFPGMGGDAFESPINTPTLQDPPTYRVAPFAGFSKARPGNGTTAIFYDIDNKRFLGWTYGQDEAARRVLTPLVDPPGALFNFQTGMELLHMESTRYSGGLVYALLAGNDGRRVILGINMSGNGFAQEVKYENLDAPGLEQATAYAFHSQYPFMFYAVDNKVYLHNLGTNTTTVQPAVDLPGEITLLKFNLYENVDLASMSDQSPEFMARQFELIVASHDATTGGHVGFYPVNGATATLSKRVAYTGFARVVDVVYRER
ncbi:MAG: hypothetical protein LBF09_02485 [Odoribacteraceae bacterium]|jgi:hypothetical protein|nr:hypothetical protein [Odoribacteraceae bacterium]